MAKNIEINVKSHTKEFMNALVEKMPLILESVGTTAEGYAKENCPVDTGLLRNSLTYAISGEKPNVSAYKADRADDSGVVRTGEYSGSVPDETEKGCYSVLVGSNVVYAARQELTDSYSHTVGKAHFIRDSIQDHRDEYREIVLAVARTIS